MSAFEFVVLMLCANQAIWGWVFVQVHRRMWNQRLRLETKIIELDTKCILARTADMAAAMGEREVKT